MRENRPETITTPLKFALIERQRKTHVAFVGFDIQFVEQCSQIRISRLIVHDETSVNRYRRAIIIDIDSSGMTAGTLFFFVKHDVMHLVQRPGSRASGNSRTNNCYLEPAIGSLLGRESVNACHATSLIMLYAAMAESRPDAWSTIGLG